MQITLQEARRLDAVVFPQVEHLCSTTRRKNFGHRDSQKKIGKLSEKLGIELQLLCSYIWLQSYLMELSDSFGEIPSPKVVAQQFGISLDEFQRYVDERACELSQRFSDQEFSEFSVQESQEIAGRGFTPQEWGSYLEDLQDDAIGEY